MSSKIVDYIMTFIHRYTKGSSNSYYATLLNWPSNSQITLGAVNPQQVSNIQMLGVKGNLNFSAASKGTNVNLPLITPDSNLKWAWVLKITSK